VPQLLPRDAAPDDSPEHRKFKRNVRIMAGGIAVSFFITGFGILWTFTFGVAGLWSGDIESLRRSVIGVLTALLGRLGVSTCTRLAKAAIATERHRIQHEMAHLPEAVERFLTQYQPED
jgi:hypothetical protein